MSAIRARRHKSAFHRHALRLETLEDRRLLAGDFELLKDIDATPIVPGVSPDQFAVVGDVAYFSAITPTYGRELWRSDGTLAGTYMVRDISVGSASSSPQLLTAVGDRLYFVADDGVHKQEIWTSDGTTEGTRPITDFSTATGTSPPFTLGAVGNLLYFAISVSNQWQLWKTAGDEASTQFVKSFMGDLNQPPQQFAAVGDVLYFAAYETPTDMELWKSDGTADGIVLVKDIFPGSAGAKPSNLVSFNGAVYFAASDGVHGYELWRSDGTEAGTVLLKDIETGTDSSMPHEFLEVGGVLYFVAGEDNAPTDLWRTDGTEMGTFRLTGAVKELVDFNGALHAFGYGSINRSDGTLAGTVNVASYSSPFFGAQEQPIVVGDAIYFVAYDGQNNEVWRSDGTQAGTAVLKNINTTGSGSASHLLLSKVGDQLVFRAFSSTSGADLWTSDGTEAGTVRIPVAPMGTRGVDVKAIAEFQGATWFHIRLGPAAGLWKTDGTEAGTMRIKAISSFFDSPLIVAGDYLYFFGDDGQTGNELWRTDGTAEGTIPVTDIEEGFPSTFTSVNPGHFAPIGDQLYFLTDVPFSPQLWKTDGTEQGTELLKTFAFNSTVGGLTNVNGTLAFVGYDSGHGAELWTSNGTPAGTVRVSEIAAGADSAFWSFMPPTFSVLGNTLYFAARDPALGAELWKWNAAAGVALVKDIHPGGQGSFDVFPGTDIFHVVGDVLYLAARDVDHGIELWKSDGTESGTVLVKDILPGTDSSIPGLWTTVGNTLYFTAINAARGVDLWKTDGTEAGTVIVRDFKIDGSGPSPMNLAEAGGQLYFKLAVEGVGDELWTTDGTPAGTVLVRDFSTDAGGSAPRNVFAAGGRLYVTATTTAYGAEIWTADLSQPLPLAGDYDDDRDVDGVDFLAWQRGFGASALPPGAGADASHNGAVGSEDLRLWAVNFSAQFDPASATLSAAANAAAIDHALLADAAAAFMRTRVSHAAAPVPQADDSPDAPLDGARPSNLKPPAVDAVHAHSPARRGRPQARSALAEIIAGELLNSLGAGPSVRL